MSSHTAELREVCVEVSLGAVRTVEQGSGSEQVVLIHGFGGDAENWRFNMATFASSRRVVAVDLPGHGKATKAVGSGEVGVLVDAVREVIDARAPGPVHLVGHSLGGLVATEIALSDPGRCASLSLIAPAGFGQIPNIGYIEGFVSAEVEDQMHLVLEMLFSNKSLVSPAFVREVLDGKARDGAQAALSVIGDRLLATDKHHLVDLGELAAARIPILVLWGTDDQVLECPTASSLHERIPVQILDGIGHSPHVEAAVQVNRSLARFFDEAVSTNRF